MTPKRLRSDKRGSVALGPVFVIVSVFILASIFAALVTAQSVGERSADQHQMANTSRSAVAAIGADLNTSTPEEIIAATGGGSGYTPDAWIPVAGEKLRVIGYTASAADRAEVTFMLYGGQDIAPWTVTVEYQHTPVVRTNGEWVRAAAADTPERSVWLPVRTITGAP